MKKKRAWYSKGLTELFFHTVLEEVENREFILKTHEIFSV